jgi:hypothetical protein
MMKRLIVTICAILSIGGLAGLGTGTAMAGTGTKGTPTGVTGAMGPGGVPVANQESGKWSGGKACEKYPQKFDFCTAPAAPPPSRSVVAPPACIANYPGFSNSAGLKLNGSAQITGGVVRLTNFFSQTGSVFSTTPFVLAQSFSTHFQFSLHNGIGPADGITFVIQNSPSGPSALGAGGGGLGYAGISPSAAIEFDIFQGPSDRDNNHVGILENGNLASYLSVASPGFKLYGSGPVNVWVDYNAATHLLQVYVSQGATKPSTPLVSATIDLSRVVGPAGYFGFTGATGGFFAVQDILSWSC